MKTLLVKAQLSSSPSRLKDGSVTLKFTTMEEIENDDFALMDQYWKQNGWLAFKLNDMSETDLPKENAVVEGQKTPSQYLRSNLFALHLAKGGTKDTFPQFYEKMMANITLEVQKKFPEEH